MPADDLRGLTQWLAGRKLVPGEQLHLKPGLYPYIVQVAPDYFPAAAARPVDAPPPPDKSTGTVAPDTGARPSVPTDSRRVSGK